MKKTILFLSAITLASIALDSCKKGDTGGNAAIVIFPIDPWGFPNKGATVYVKFDTQSVPSDPASNYDLKIAGDVNQDYVRIEGLRYGKYYLYVAGFDTICGCEFEGGLPLKIKWSERKNDIDVNIQLSN
jgi:hypothetical protein